MTNHCIRELSKVGWDGRKQKTRVINNLILNKFGKFDQFLFGLIYTRVFKIQQKQNTYLYDKYFFFIETEFIQQLKEAHIQKYLKDYNFAELKKRNYKLYLFYLEIIDLMRIKNKQGRIGEANFLEVFEVNIVILLSRVSSLNIFNLKNKLNSSFWRTFLENQFRQNGIEPVPSKIENFMGILKILEFVYYKNKINFSKFELSFEFYNSVFEITTKKLFLLELYKVYKGKGVGGDRELLRGVIEATF